MPEAPELEVVKEFLNERVKGSSVVAARVLRPSVLRGLAGELTTDISGRTFEEAERRGKFLLLALSGNRLLVVNPMLTGGLQYCAPAERVFKRTCLIFSLSSGQEFRYLDDRQMGRVYYASNDQLGKIPQLHDMGPDVLDPIPFEEFQGRLKPFHGEIKGILTRGRLISGIGNAYADEILFAAEIYPFRKKKELTEEELRRLHRETHAVVADATNMVRARMGERIDTKVRDFLKVHNRGGEQCPRCGSRISQITANQRITSYCRRCQPGMLIKN